ncbi:MAG: SWIM zinc finger family protein [Candidatus Dormibacteraeota bacterium]|nr:SWIM zinc finger family protein [Candidatus Dormibacteraeota bacterium]
MAATEVVFAYPRPSRLVETTGAPTMVDLSTLAPWVGGAPAFFDGWLPRPRQAATLLLTVAAIARSRYFLRISPLLLDPILTSGDDRLRLEAFSSCCGVYARADLLPDGLRQVTVGNGTTNVDCNPALRAALALVDDSTPTRLTVGTGGIEVATPDGISFERRVKLPRRWIKGLGEAGLAQVDMQPCFQVGAPAARRFLAAIPPEGAASAPEYVVAQRGRDLVFTRRGVAGMPWVAGPFRLRELRPLAHFATTLRVWARPGGGPGPSAWELELPGARFWLVLSPSVYRGFSGEGQALEALADEELVAEAVALRARLDGVSPPGGRDGGEPLAGPRPGWRARLDEAEIAALAGFGVDRARDLLAVLGSQGLVGRDLAEDGWFRRDLPFSAELIPLLQPRVRRAAEITSADLSARRLPGGAVEVFVRSGDIEHRVLLDGDGASCTCLWYVRHAGSRGPCRHIIAARRLKPRPAP